MDDGLKPEEYMELDKDAAEFYFECEKNEIKPWSFDSTGLGMPKMMAQFGAEWYKKKVMERNKYLYHCITKYFNEDSYSSYKSLESYIEDIYNNKEIEVVDLKITFEEMNVDKPNRYRIFVIYRNI